MYSPFLVSDADFWWNWMVQLATAVATFLAVVAALFLGFRDRFFPPRLILDLVDPRGSQAVKAFISRDNQPVFETMSHWYQLRVENARRVSRATDTQVCLLEFGVPDAAGKYVMQSVGAIPLTVRHSAIVRSVIGPPVEFTLCSVYREDAEHRAPFFKLHPVVAPTDISTQFNQPFKIMLVLQARSIEADSDLRRIEVIWNGQWSDDTKQMNNNLVFNVQ
jgi:hypothetical protein